MALYRAPNSRLPFCPPWREGFIPQKEGKIMASFQVVNLCAACGKQECETIGHGRVRGTKTYVVLCKERYQEPIPRMVGYKGVILVIGETRSKTVPATGSLLALGEAERNRDELEEIFEERDLCALVGHEGGGEWDGNPFPTAEWLVAQRCKHCGANRYVSGGTTGVERLGILTLPEPAHGSACGSFFGEKENRNGSIFLSPSISFSISIEGDESEGLCFLKIFLEDRANEASRLR